MKIQHQNTAKGILKGNLLKRNQIDDLTFYFKELEKEEQIKARASRTKKQAHTNELINKKQ